jgi:hypothetical protein
MCDCLCALPTAAPTDVTVFAKNSDRPPLEPQVVEWHPPRQERATRATYVEIPGHDRPTIGFVGSRPSWMWGVEHGVNEAGVAVGNEAVFTTSDPTVAPDALVGMDLVRLALERAPDASAAVEVITSLIEVHHQGGSGHDPAGGHDFRYWSSFLVADPTVAFVVETSGDRWDVERVADRRAISNRLTIPAFDAAHRDTDPGLAPMIDPRWEASRARLEAGRFDVDAARTHLRSHVGGADGWTICMHVAGLEATTAALVAELPSGGSPPVARFLLGSPCRSVFVPVVVGLPLGEPPRWERFAALTDAHRPVLDLLEAELDASVAAAGGAWDEGCNAQAWARVTDVLDALGV